MSACRTPQGHNIWLGVVNEAGPGKGTRIGGWKRVYRIRASREGLLTKEPR
jgi:hypothetical protein